MAFRLPAFPLTANLWRAYNANVGPMPPTRAPDLTFQCQIRVTITAMIENTVTNNTARAVILMPKGTDARGFHPGTLLDMVEIPAGTGRFYAVELVEDRAKGFPNEHRAAGVQQYTGVAGGWPYPTP